MWVSDIFPTIPMIEYLCATVTVISNWYQVSLFPPTRQRVPTSKRSRLTRIGKFISSSHHWVGQCIPMPEHKTGKDHVAHTRSSKKAFQSTSFNGTQTQNSPTNWCRARQSQTDYSPQVHCTRRKSKIAMGAITTAKKLTPLGSRHCHTALQSTQMCMPNKAITAIKQKIFQKPATSLLGWEGVHKISKSVTDQPKQPLCGIASMSLG